MCLSIFAVIVKHVKATATAKLIILKRVSEKLHCVTGCGREAVRIGLKTHAKRRKTYGRLRRMASISEPYAK